MTVYSVGKSIPITISNLCISSNCQTTTIIEYKEHLKFFSHKSASFLTLSLINQILTCERAAANVFRGNYCGNLTASLDDVHMRHTTASLEWLWDVSQQKCKDTLSCFTSLYRMRPLLDVNAMSIFKTLASLNILFSSFPCFEI